MDRAVGVMPHKSEEDIMDVDVRLLAMQTIGLFFVFAIALFLPAGTIAWIAGWIFLVMFFGFFLAVNIWLSRHNPGLLQERTHFLGTSDQRNWDRVLFPLLEVFCFAWLVLMGLDAVRFHWSRVPAWVQCVGAFVLLCSFYLLFLTFRENSYLSPVVRVQKERGQTVISTGPYHYVRHPMYSAIVVFVVGTAFLLGSWYGVLFGPMIVAVLARRAVLEERMLCEELVGYAAYMRQVRYRLIPYVW
jgi:protein-S-isoprenylcysteine O-methyltransferase Ste14